ncbi:MAG: L-alanine exporter AlaE [Candidatus Bathyarchaeota archaeon]|nr:L-alanine exporter AlaE [Candidatus Bathyarchaeota archaeon]
MIGERLSNWIYQHIIPKTRDVMSTPVLSVSFDTSILETIRLMYDKRLGSVIVIKEKIPVGIFTRRDLLGRVLLKNVSLTELKVSEVMSSPVYAIQVKDQVIKAVDLMNKKGISRVVVMDEIKPEGILTRTDIQLTLSKSSLSPKLIFKKYIVDTLAYILFWSWINICIQIVVVGISFEKFIISSIYGFIATLLIGGLFGGFLDVFRKKFEVD